MVLQLLSLDQYIVSFCLIFSRLKTNRAYSFAPVIGLQSGKTNKAHGFLFFTFSKIKQIKHIVLEKLAHLYRDKTGRFPKQFQNVGPLKNITRINCISLERTNFPLKEVKRSDMYSMIPWKRVKVKMHQEQTDLHIPASLFYLLTHICLCLFMPFLFLFLFCYEY